MVQDLIAVIDDEPNIRMVLKAQLERGGFRVHDFPGFTAAKASLETERYHCLITDLSMPEHTGLDVLHYIKAYSPHVPVVFITAVGTIESAVIALKNGAYDFIQKPFSADYLIEVVTRAVSTQKNRFRESSAGLGLGESSFAQAAFGGVAVPLMGESATARSLRDQVARAAAAQDAVCVVGPTGVGHRSVAQEIHRKSDRVRFPFVEVYLSAIPSAFQNFELFGFERGAHPLAVSAKPGRLELAHQGSLFLDDLSYLGQDAQIRLETSLGSGFFRRDAGFEARPLTARLMTTMSTNRTGKPWEGFRSDLYYQLTSRLIVLPPLMDRKEDLETAFIPHFFERSLRKLGVEPQYECESGAVSVFLEHPWEGNFSELNRVVERLVQNAVARSNRHVRITADQVYEQLQNLPNSPDPIR